MRCSNCGIELNRSVTLVATVTSIREDSIKLSVSEVEDRPLRIRGKKPICFPYITQQGMDELELCGLQCLKEKLNEAIKSVV